MTVPATWMPSAKMERIIVHWTAGAHKASELDRDHYHVLVEATGKLVRGTKSIRLNRAPAAKGYAAHTLNCNSGSIGVSMCCMAGAIENPFSAGKAPMTRVQWDVMMGVIADLCLAYRIPVTARTVLSHAEVQGTLGIKQRGKWDIARLAFDPTVKGAKACGDRMRREVSALLAGKGKAPAEPAPPVVAPAPVEPATPVPAAPEIAAEILDEPAEPAVPVASLEVSKDVVVRVQTLLREKGYYSVGPIDGDAGGTTQGAILAFRNDNKLPLKPTIDDAFVAALEAAPARYIAPERAEATAAELSVPGSPVAEPLRQSWWQRAMAWVLGIPALIASAFSGIKQFFGDALDQLTPFRDFLGDVPVWVWGLGVGSVAFLIWLSARKSAAKQVTMYRTGQVA